MDKINNPDANDFSIVLGGPFFQLLRKAHLTSNALDLIKKRVILITLITWLPLLLFTIFSGEAWGDKLAIPFIYDIEVHIRFLIAVPLLVAAEVLVHKRLRLVVRQFYERDLIAGETIAEFEKAISNAYKWRNSFVAESLLLLIVYGLGVLIIWKQFTSINVETWYAKPVSGGGKELNLSGIWYGFISIPFFQFLLLRWHYRIFIWIRFLFKVSKIKLKLIPTHPDQVGGLGFLTNITQVFLPIAFAHGVVVAAIIAHRIFQQGTPLLDFKVEIISIAVFILIIVLLPLLFFSPQLAQMKRQGINNYGKLAMQYVREFDEKWLRKNNPSDEQFIGSADIQSLADMGNSYEVVSKIKVVLITRESIFSIVLFTIAPILPLALTMMPLSELLNTLAKVLL